MMTEDKFYLTMLGTGQATVTKCYNTCFVFSEKEQCFLVDAGGGNQILRILEEQGIGLAQIHDLFLTHTHSDHILGAIWVIRMIGQLMLRGTYAEDFRIYACKEAMEDLQTICGIVLEPKIMALFGNRMHLIVLRDGESYSILHRTVTFFDILSTKRVQYGFAIEEERLLFCGDEPLKKELYGRAKGCRYLLHEAFCLYSEREQFKPYEKHHGTVKDACVMAEENRVENLILMHTEDSHIQERKERYREEGQQFFSGNLLVPDDGERILISAVQ